MRFGVCSIARTYVPSAPFGTGRTEYVEIDERFLGDSQPLFMAYPASSALESVGTYA